VGIGRHAGQGGFLEQRVAHVGQCGGGVRRQVAGRGDFQQRKRAVILVCIVAGMLAWSSVRSSQAFDVGDVERALSRVVDDGAGNQPTGISPSNRDWPGAK